MISLLGGGLDWSQDPELISAGCIYEGIAFDGYIPIWVRPPVSGERCPWTSLSHGSFFNWLGERGQHVIAHKLNKETDSGVILYWLPSLIHQFRHIEAGIGDAIEGQKLRKLLFPVIPPIFIRMPERGQRCPWTSLSQSSFIQLQKNYGRAIGSKLGNGRGSMLVYLPDLMQVMLKDADYLMKLVV